MSPSSGRVKPEVISRQGRREPPNGPTKEKKRWCEQHGLRGGQGGKALHIARLQREDLSVLSFGLPCPNVFRNSSKRKVALHYLTHGDETQACIVSRMKFSSNSGQSVTQVAGYRFINDSKIGTQSAW